MRARVEPIAYPEESRDQQHYGRSDQECRTFIDGSLSKMLMSVPLVISDQWSALITDRYRHLIRVALSSVGIAFASLRSVGVSSFRLSTNIRSFRHSPRSLYFPTNTREFPQSGITIETPARGPALQPDSVAPHCTAPAPRLALLWPLPKLSAR